MGKPYVDRLAEFLAPGWHFHSSDSPSILAPGESDGLMSSMTQSEARGVTNCNQGTHNKTNSIWNTVQVAQKHWIDEAKSVFCLAI
jgi:hypothetical protein